MNKKCDNCGRIARGENDEQDICDNCNKNIFDEYGKHYKGDVQK